MKGLLRFSAILSVLSVCAALDSNIYAAPEKELLQPLFAIEGRNFSSSDLTVSEQNRLHELKTNYYKAVEGIARQRFVELKTLPHKSLNSKEKPFAAEEKWLAQSYEPVSSEIDKALESFKDEKQLQQLPVAERGKVISRYLVSQKRAKVLTDVTDKAIGSGVIRLALARPQAPVAEISKSTQPVLGNAAGAVRVVEFTDFQCPYCKKFADTGAQVLKKYGSKVVWEVRHFPLSFHKQARAAAASVYCAALQGKLAEAKKWVFDAQDKLAEEKVFIQMAESLALEKSKFEKCRTDESTVKVIEADLKEGERIGVAGTPSVFVNGQKFEGDPSSLEAWDEALKSAQIK
ncbi:MAG: hypothetical protein EBR09_10245 [Proteobacteria bacterium]|nr:hypothetical protein [Pseudomonadota bacterium]